MEPKREKPIGSKAAGIAVAVTLATGGAVAIDETQQAIPLDCANRVEQVESIERVAKEYKIDEGFVATRDITGKDLANIKACEIKKRVPPTSIHERSGSTTIQIMEVETFDEGVSVYARVWKNGKQIGFGPDGTVDIERFRIINPPVLVPDNNGPIERVYTTQELDGTVSTSSRKFREDAVEAMLQVIEHNLTVMTNIHDDSKIVNGKRGRTTSTFYPDADTESTSVDGNMLDTACGSWSSCVSSTNANLVQDSAATNDNFFQLRTNILGRIILLFDTSAIGSDTISSATLSQQLAYVTTDSNSNQAVNVVSSAPASDTAIVGGDMDSFGSTRFTTDFTITSAMTAFAYRDFSLNASGLANIDGSGVSKFGIRFAADLDNSDPGSNKIRVKGEYADNTGTSVDPKLVVEHTAASSRRIFLVE